MMTVGVRNTIGTINQGDTAELYAALRVDEVPTDPTHIVAVNFTVAKPDDTMVNMPGIVQDDGQGYLQWTDTTQTGEYLARAQFSLDTGEVRSVMVSFGVKNPFEVLPQTPTDLITEAVWLRLEDIWDSTEGGPWLRDMTLAYFDQDKIANFIPEILLEMNVQMPPTHAVLADFTTPQADGSLNELAPLLIQGVLCATMKHLMRSYAEQPVPTGAQIVYEDRTRYTQTWMQIYQLEHQEFLDRVRLWKRQLLGLGKSALLLGSKAGRLYFGQGMRTRNAGRGYF